MRPVSTFPFLILALAPTVSAGPWTRQAGESYSRVAYADEAIEGETARRADAYFEYGVLPRLTVTAKLEQVDYGHSELLDSTAWRTTARYRLFQHRGFVGSVEAGLVEGAAISGRLGCEKLGAELRTGLAWFGQVRRTETFTFVEIAGRDHGDCQTRRLEAGTGQALGWNLWIISQLWLEQGDHGQPSNKAQTELLWRLDQVDLSLGYREGLTGPYAERAVVFSIARRF